MLCCSEPTPRTYPNIFENKKLKINTMFLKNRIISFHPYASEVRVELTFSPCPNFIIPISPIEFPIKHNHKTPLLFLKPVKRNFTRDELTFNASPIFVAPFSEISFPIHVYLLRTTVNLF